MFVTTKSNYICGKCSLPAYPSQHDPRPLISVQVPVTAEINHLEQLPSPPRVSVSLKTISKSHSYCFICKKEGPKLIVVPSKLRTDTVVKYSVLITAESRCCPAHLNVSRDCFQANIIDNNIRLCVIKPNYSRKRHKRNKAVCPQFIIYKNVI